jgi:hypothetical protein
VCGGHSHRFRDTFAVEVLLSGVPLERVSVLLGHSSTWVTELWALGEGARQEQLELDVVMRNWNLDPLTLASAKGTPETGGR